MTAQNKKLIWLNHILNGIGNTSKAGLLLKMTVQKAESSSSSATYNPYRHGKSGACSDKMEKGRLESTKYKVTVEKPKIRTYMDYDKEFVNFQIKHFIN